MQNSFQWGRKWANRGKTLAVHGMKAERVPFLSVGLVSSVSLVLRKPIRCSVFKIKSFKSLNPSSFPITGIVGNSLFESGKGLAQELAGHSDKVHLLWFPRPKALVEEPVPSVEPRGTESTKVRGFPGAGIPLFLSQACSLRSPNWLIWGQGQ